MCKKEETGCAKARSRNKHVFRAVPAKTMRYIERDAVDKGWDQTLKGFGSYDQEMRLFPFRI